LPANDEQRRIIRTLSRQNGVLVQGPPGTGKSHTIANLICHLLATGKRVLVTAKTPRALQVLRAKLPSEIKPLCINLLGQGAEERESLERSVTGILTRIDRKEEADNGNRIQLLEKRIQNNRQEKAATDHKIMALRESETFVHTIANAHYTGTAAQIARELRKDAEVYSWFTDNIKPETALPLSPDEIKCLCRDVVEIDQQTENDLSHLLPDPEKDHPCGDELRSVFQKEAETREKVAAGKERLNSHECKTLLQAGEEKILPLFQNLSEFNAATETIRQRPMPWIDKAVYDVLTDRDTPWKELLKLSTQHIGAIYELAEQVDAFDVSISESMDRKKLIHDAKALKEHFVSGGGSGVWIFKPKAVREHGDLIGKVKVDGLDCNTTESLQKLIDFLTVEQQLNYVWSLWSGKVDRQNGPFPLQVAEIKELHEALESIISLYGKREGVKEKLEQVSGLRPPRWEDTGSLISLIEDCRIVLSQINFLRVNNELTKIQNCLSDLSSRNNAHTINDKILKSFEDQTSSTHT
jgi:hypothetical protein